MADTWWNGPGYTAQDFQTSNIACEVKSTTANTLNLVTISSIDQLEKNNLDKLYLAAYRLNMDQLNGITLPEKIDEVKELVPENRRDLFEASRL